MSRLIDAKKYERELLKAYDDVSLEFDVLDKQPTVNAIIIPEGATNGDMIKAMFPNTENRLDERTGITLVLWEDGTTKCYKTDWWNAPYERKVEE